MAGSSSCQCLTTLCGMQKETQNNVNTIHRRLRNMLANSLAVIGLSWSLDQKEKGTETYTHKPDRSLGRMAQEMMANFSRSGQRGELRSKGGDERSQYTSMVPMKPSSCGSAQ